MQFLNKAFIPQSKVRLAAVGEKYNDLTAALKKDGIETIGVKKYKSGGDNPELLHADMQLLYIGGGRIIGIKENDELNIRLKRLCLDVTETADTITEFKYPQCVKINCIIINRRVISNLKYTDQRVFELLPDYKFININQGYGKCSAAIVNDNALITSDASVFKAAAENNIDCLKIREGFINLCEKYHGFIGGASFLLDKDILGFSGDIKTHPDYNNIKAFCLSHRINLYSVIGGELTDVGGVIPLMEDSK